MGSEVQERSEKKVEGSEETAKGSRKKMLRRKRATGIDREDLEALWRVTIWKLIDSSGVHFVRFENVHIFMLVEKRYPITPITFTNMLNTEIQTNHSNEIVLSAAKAYGRNLKIQKMNIKFRGGLLGLKRLHGFLEVTTAQVHNGNYAKWWSGVGSMQGDVGLSRRMWVVKPSDAGRVVVEGEKNGNVM
ncbi:hypothetical protein Tco_0578870 [Tanacetum coccineum]